MVDPNFAAAISRDAGPDEHTLLLEVGPGTGCLTTALLKGCAAARILAIEIDRGLCGLLRETFADEITRGRLSLLEGDALAGKHGISPALVEAALRISAAERRPRRVLCANLPYNAATPLLANLAADKEGLNIAGAVVTVQRELAERMLARPATPQYSALSAFLALRANGRILRRVGNEVFWPRPKIESAVLRLDFKPWGSPLRRNEAADLQAFLQKVFSQRRKMLRALLKPKSIPAALPIPANARAEELTPETLLDLFRAVGM